MNGIEIKALSLAFGSGPNVLEDIALSIRPGEFIALVGPSGCGKTTLLNLMAGLVPVTPNVTAGSIEVFGAPPALGSHCIGYMLARDSLLPWATAQENAEFGLRVRGVAKAERAQRAAAFINKVGLKEHSESLPKQLSHGMRQRVALARTFALGSPLLLMDEPFGALDAQTKLHLQDQLLQLTQAEQRTVVFVTHDLAEAVTVADRVVVMSARPGKIIADVPIDLPRPRSVRALLQDPAFHAAYAKVWKLLESGWSHHED